MSIIIEQFQKVKNKILEEQKGDSGNQVMNKVIVLVNELGQDFKTLNGGELSEIQMKLAGYKFYLADYLADLNQKSEALKMYLKQLKADRWDNITEQIRAIDGKVKNREQIENIFVTETLDIANEQILYENMFYKYRMKINAVDDILTAIVQRIAELKRQLENQKNL
jgi:hypothetical protein